MTPAAYALVNLDAIRHNIQVVREYAPEAKIMAVIKANGYGHGMLRVAEALDAVDAVAVARSDEAIRLRKIGFSKRITVLEGFVCEQELNDLEGYDLEVVIHSSGQIDILEQRSTKNKITCWLKFDSGMNRLGFKQEDFLNAYQRLSGCKSVDPEIFLMTHLSSADDLSNAVTTQQINLFNNNIENLDNQKSIANSAAILAWSHSITDWVRPGIMLYGVSPFADKKGVDFDLKPVMSLHSRLISVKTLSAGEAVGYAGAWVSESDMRLGVVAIGYGDGYPRYAKFGTPVLIKGKRVPLVGRVSMDMITVDLSAVEDAKAGDLVTLWGDGLPVEEIARYADTIPYTLLCGITQRVEIKLPDVNAQP